ncbi:hypothetical protein BCV69DRAFT_311977 [Microstroma glucosiphilum]|uniref:Mitochondrial inner membrane protease subunit 2 n=1 Tax=Pseudomicrostroma glucosiphilum TaxID=1684307 RepID=A0A316UAH4_9BASI|nr:hypothetical protein BCV69DRAFT_311977 [Pseudomicrostroma glucosiphilum]PWN21471.1 hypothetical protein BCV69DRAFT_311977 [Pseudomicrostroma glucosiphilum]
METRCSWARTTLRAAAPSGSGIAARSATVRLATTAAGPSRPPPPGSSASTAPNRSQSSPLDPSSSSPSGSGSPPPPRDEVRTFMQRVLPWIPVAIPIAAVLYSTTYSIGTVNGGSMVPTLNPEFSSLGISATRDWVILNRLKAMYNSWQVGEVVVMVSPIDPNTHSVKRILAMPGDIVRYPYKRRIETSPGQYRQVNGHRRIKIPPGHCWVEGDSSIYSNANAPVDETKAPGSAKASSRRRKEAAHLDLSRDSRHFGPIPLALLTAKVSLIFYPFNRFGTIPDRPGQGPTNLSTTSAASPAEERKAKPQTGWWPFTGGGGSASGSGASAGGAEEEDWWKRAEEDSRLTPYADEESQVGSIEAGKQRVRFMDSGAAAPSSHPLDGSHDLDRSDEAQTVPMPKPVSWTLFSRRARSDQDLPSSVGSYSKDIPPALLRPAHRHLHQRPPPPSPSSLEEDDALFTEKKPKRRPLYKQRHASELSVEEVEQRRRRLNAMSRGGKLGDAQLHRDFRAVVNAL